VPVVIGRRAARSTWSLDIAAEMAKPSLRAASLYCLGTWAAIWLLFMLIRFSSFDIRVIPGIGPVMLFALAFVWIAPAVATGLAGVALIRQPRVRQNWLAFGCALAALVGQAFLFNASRWL
jgi:hypothetical protein